MTSNAVKIPLTRGKFALVDKRDAKRVSKHKWCMTKQPNSCYAVRNICIDGRQKMIYLHRFIMDAQPGQIIDHIDGDGLNNTRKNLRFVTRSQNNYNRHVRTSNTGFLGVTRVSEKRKSRFQAKVECKRKKVLKKHFLTKYEAAAMYDHVKRGIAGVFGSYNFTDLLTANQMRDIIYKSNGFFSVVFRKRSDSDVRHMTARVGVKKFLKGGTLRFDPHKKRLATVFDLSKKKYRLIPIDGILALKINGKYYGRLPEGERK